MTRRYATFVVASYLLSFAARHAAFGQCEVHETAKLTASDAAPSDAFGRSVSVSGEVAVVGAAGACATGLDCGSAYVYRFDGSTWVEEAKLTASDAAAGDDFGHSVSVSGDVAVVGAAWDDCGAEFSCGSAYVYRYDGSNWIQEAKLTASDAAPDDVFGSSVSVSGDVAVVGAIWDDCAVGSFCGSAYIYRFNGSAWVQQAKLTASDGAQHAYFGVSVSVSGDVAVVGAFGDDCTAGVDCGAAYVYRFNGNDWVEEGKLTASDRAAGDLFGNGVSVSEEVAVVGAYNDDSAAGIDCGSAYVYRFNGGSWVEETKLTASDAAAQDFFGGSVSVSGDVAVAGAFNHYACGGFFCGSAYVYRFNPSAPGRWVEEQRLTASDGAYLDAFGGAVSVSGNTVVVGAYADDCAAGSYCGSAYAYATLAVTSPPCPWPDPSGTNKNRSLAFSFSPPVTAGPGSPTALRVRMMDLQNPGPGNAPCCPPPDFSAYESATCTASGEANGCVRWAGKPGTFLESQGNSGAGNYRAARLQCTPHYHHWSGEELIHVVGAEVVPSSTYEVENLAESCMGIEDTCTALSMPLTIRTARFGDVAAPYNPPGTTTQPDAIDVTQLVNKFKNLPGAPIKPIAQLQPNLPELNADINALDVVAVVDAFKGSAYPFSGPCPCPSTVMCNTVECPSGPAACVTAFGAGAMCVKTCDTGDNAGEPCIDNGHCPGGGTCGNVFCRDRCGRCTP
ncbi:MAG: FG-GAP repeat protein [Planctomycetota bacterium]